MAPAGRRWSLPIGAAFIGFPSGAVPAQAAPNASAMAMRGRQLSAGRLRLRAKASGALCRRLTSLPNFITNTRIPAEANTPNAANAALPSLFVVCRHLSRIQCFGNSYKTALRSWSLPSAELPSDRESRAGPAAAAGPAARYATGPEPPDPIGQNPEGSKAERMVAQSAKIKAGHVHLPRG